MNGPTRTSRLANGRAGEGVSSGEEPSQPPSPEATLIYPSGPAAWTRSTLVLAVIALATVAATRGGPGLAWTFALLCVLLVLSAFFSSSETALFSLQNLDLEVLKEHGPTGRLLYRLLSRPRAVLVTILMGNESTKVTLSAVAAGVTLQLLPDHPWVNVVVVLPLLILLGEVIPKSLALPFNRGWARGVAHPLLGFHLAVTPVRWVLIGIVDLLAALFFARGHLKPRQVMEAEFLALVDLGQAQGSLKASEQEFIQALFELDDLPVGRIMTPRPDLVMLDITAPWPEILETFRQHGLSRVPVYQEDKDNVLGVLMAKDLLRFLGRPPPKTRQLRHLLHRPLFVPTFKRADELLSEFRSRRAHLALVVDEHGSLAGLVTLDDLLGELLGMMHDESDEDEPGEVQEREDGSYTVNASMDIEDVVERLGLDLPEGDYSTLGGFVLSRTMALPARGQVVTWEGAELQVTRVVGRRITEVLVKLPDAPLAREES